MILILKSLYVFLKWITYTGVTIAFFSALYTIPNLINEIYPYGSSKTRLIENMIFFPFSLFVLVVILMIPYIITKSLKIYTNKNEIIKWVKEN